MGARRWFSPTAAHYLSLVAAFAWIAYCGRHQWFFYDEWDFLKLSSTDWLTPHLGHWSTAPMLLTAGIRSLIGLDSYWPFLLPAVLVHLGIAHLVWRLSRRAGVSPWIAVLLAFVVALYGAGSENILWAFQFGFLGAVLLGLIAVLLADGLDREHFWTRGLVIAALTVFSLTFSGTAIPMTAAVAVVGLRRVGVGRAVLLVVPAAAVYLAWYLYARSNPVYFMPPGPESRPVVDLVLGVGSFALRMIVGGLEGLTPVPLLGVVLTVALLGYGIVRARRLWRGSPLVVGLAGSALCFGLLTGWSRLDFSADTADASRYVYLTTVLLLPLAGLLGTELAALHRSVEIILLAAIGLTALYGANTLRVAGSQQAAIEQHTRQVLYAAVDSMQRPGSQVDDSAYPDPDFAPSVTMADLRALVDAGRLTTPRMHDAEQQLHIDERRPE